MKTILLNWKWKLVLLSSTDISKIRMLNVIIILNGLIPSLLIYFIILLFLSSNAQVLYYHFAYAFCSIFAFIKKPNIFSHTKATKRITRQWHVVLEI